MRWNERSRGLIAFCGRRHRDAICEREFDPGERPSIVSLIDRVKPVAIGTAVTSVHFLGDRAAFVGAEEHVSLVDAEGAISKVAIHSGGILCAVSDGKRLITGGDDGKVTALDAKGEVAQLVVDAKRRWIDNVAVHPDGTFAWSAGKTAFVKSGKGEKKTFKISKASLKVSKMKGKNDSEPSSHSDLVKAVEGAKGKCGLTATLEVDGDKATEVKFGGGRRRMKKTDLE